MRRLVALLWIAATARAICHDATVTALTGRLNLATYIEGGLDAGDKCTYAIKPSSSSSMQTLVLVFEELQCDGCEIFLYEGEERVSEAQLWRCVSYDRSVLGEGIHCLPRPDCLVRTSECSVADTGRRIRR